MNDDIKPTPSPANTEPEGVEPAQPSAETNQPAEAPAPVATQPTATPEPTEPASPAVNNSVVSDASHSHKGRNFLLTLLVLILIAAGVVVGWHFYKNTGSNSVASTMQKKEVPLLRVGVSDPFPTSFYPQDSLDLSEGEINQQIFEGLTQFQNNTKVVPGLATSWSNPNNTTWVFKIRPNVYFHDGHLLNAQSVKAALDDSKALNTDSWQSYGQTIADVSVVDPGTVKITTNGPDPLLANELSYLYIYDTTSGKKDDPVNGTGPYVLKPGTKLTANSLKLVAFDRYHGGKPLTREVDFSYVDYNGPAVTALKQNKLDLAEVNESSLINQLSGSFVSQPVSTLSIGFLVPHTTTAGTPLSKLPVRQAIYGSLDKQALLTAHQGGVGVVADQMVPQEVAGYDPSIKPLHYTAAEAKAMLARAGYPNGFTLKFTYFAPAQSLADELKKELQPLGITVQEDPQTDGKTLANIAYGGKTDMYYISNGTGVFDLSDVFANMISGQNNYSDPSLTPLVNKVSTDLDPTSRIQTLQKMNDSVMSNVGLMPLFTADVNIEARASMHLALTQQDNNGVPGLYYWQVYSKQ